MKRFKELTDNEKKIAKSMGYNGLFASRDNLSEAHEYGAEVAKTFGDEEIMVLTALMVLNNTWAILYAQRVSGESE